MAQNFKPVSGFPEWSPEVRRIEQQWLDIIRTVFESHGYASIETAAVEEVGVIKAKGDDVDKEIYTLSRLNEDRDHPDESRLALHFDLTVPMARYVAQRYNDLTFPFKRYQIQPSWRGERPQEGRYRQFIQADIDVIDRENLSIAFDAEMPLILYKIFNRIGIDRVEIHINNRKVIQGYYQGLGVRDAMQVVSIMDKLDKIGAKGVTEMLIEAQNLDPKTIEACLALAQIKTTDGSFAAAVEKLGVKNDLLTEGLEELKYVMDSLSHLPAGTVVADMSIARGLAYYTGTVYECRFADYPEFSTIAGGGRYENLVGDYLNAKLPGVGISFGLTRILGKMLKEGRLAIGEQTPTEVLIVRLPGADVAALNAKAEALRDRGIYVEVFHKEAKMDKQIKYANEKGIPYLLFAGDKDEVKDLAAREQKEVDLKTWQPEARGYRSFLSPAAKKSVLPKA